MVSVIWSTCRSVSCQQANHPSRCHPSARLFCGDKNEAQHTAWAGARSLLVCLLFLSCCQIRQTNRQPCHCPTGRNNARLVRPRVTQRMHVLFSFLTSCLLRIPTVLCSLPLLGYRDPGRWDAWRPTYMKSCFSDGGCSCSLAALLFPDVFVCFLTGDPPRHSGIFYNVAQDRFWCLEQSRRFGRRKQAARHKEHASQRRPTVASVSCNGDAESRTIEFILHNIIHKYHVVSSVHESRNLLPTCAHRLFPGFFFSSFPFVLARTTCMLNAQRPTLQMPTPPNARCRPPSYVAPTPG